VAGPSPPMQTGEKESLLPARQAGSKASREAAGIGCRGLSERQALRRSRRITPMMRCSEITWFPNTKCREAKAIVSKYPAL
jgi:hypothetical protein